ncbi:MAG TPA: hypothetical protein VLT47_09535 [Anaeromyxobacteraceae bacterium]|nr:hypothetical protein [Anaeromyxobacteraceae bacterium]
MSHLRLGTSILAGSRAAAREAWLLPVSALLSVLRTAATAPALAVALVLPVQGAIAGARHRPISLFAPVEGALAVIGSGRYRALVAGLLLAGIALGGLVRVIFLAGALPTLGASLAGADATRRFAPGVVWGLPRQLATWLLAALAELGAAGFLAAGATAAVLVAGEGVRSPFLAAALGAAVLTVGLGGLVAARVVGDVAAARAAILGEGAARAFSGAARRLLSQPGPFLLGGLAAAFAGAAATSVLGPAEGVLGAVAGHLQGAVLVGPRLILASFATLIAAAVDLAWLGTAAALACAGDASALQPPPEGDLAHVQRGEVQEEAPEGGQHPGDE